jgi:hypothetical protein
MMQFMVVVKQGISSASIHFANPFCSVRKRTDMLALNDESFTENTIASFDD